MIYFFALHALVLTTVTIGQCFIYDRGTQRVHPVTWGIIGLAGLAAVVLIILAGAFSGILIWLDIIYYFSYVKIGATLLKYIPQAYFNYERKSTDGWSIGNILLDITGGILSFFQLFVDAAESGNWKVFTGDPAKLALAMISIFSISYLSFNITASTEKQKTTRCCQKKLRTSVSKI